MQRELLSQSHLPHPPRRIGSSLILYLPLLTTSLLSFLLPYLPAHIPPFLPLLPLSTSFPFSLCLSVPLPLPLPPSLPPIFLATCHVPLPLRLLPPPPLPFILHRVVAACATAFLQSLQKKQPSRIAILLSPSSWPPVWVSKQSVYPESIRHVLRRFIMIINTIIGSNKLKTCTICLKDSECSSPLFRNRSIDVDFRRFIGRNSLRFSSTSVMESQWSEVSFLLM